MLKKLLVLLTISGIGLVAKAQEKLTDNFFMKKLNNGMEILVIEDANVPLATIEICVKNGAYTEDAEYNGLSHLYEHMFFKANKTYPSQKAFLDRVNELGISFNGTTSDERVNYFFTLSKDKLAEGIDFMNSAIRYPLFDTAEMRRENPVVAGEFQRAESNPFFTLMDKSNREVWQDNYSRKNPIGDYKIIYSATTEKMNVIKNKYYWPNNSLLAKRSACELRSRGIHEYLTSDGECAARACAASSRIFECLICQRPLICSTTNLLSIWTSTVASGSRE